MCWPPRGVRFTRAYVQSPVCGASRMSFYTGRYVQSHGAAWNGYPLKVGEMTLGDYLRPLGVRTALVGKTHMRADTEGMQRLGIDPSSIIGVRVAECGFDPYERDDGLHWRRPRRPLRSAGPALQPLPQRQGLCRRQSLARLGQRRARRRQRLASGWAMRHARKPARVDEEDSETPYMTRRAMDFIAEAGDEPWCLHLSYIKPHWPYIAPAPYNAMYGAERRAARRALARRSARDPHPVYRAFMDLRVSSDLRARRGARGGHPGLHGPHQADRRSAGPAVPLHARSAGCFDNTMIVFTSDHGDYLGDHWLGEKDLFHEPSVKVPLIVCDPSPEADGARGTVCDELVEAIDLAPTFLEALGADPAAQSHRLEGRSLAAVPARRGAGAWRRFAISEYDYAMLPVAAKLGIEPRDARLFMVADKRWKYVHALGLPADALRSGGRPRRISRSRRRSGLRGRAPPPGGRARMQWGLRLSQRTTLSEQQIAASARQVAAPRHPDRRVGREATCPTSCGASIEATSR